MLEGLELFIHACREGCLDTVHDLLSKGADVNASDGVGHYLISDAL